MNIGLDSISVSLPYLLTVLARGKHQWIVRTVAVVVETLKPDRPPIQARGRVGATNQAFYSHQTLLL